MNNITSKKMRWAGWTLTILPVLFLLFDATIHLMGLPMVREAFQQLGYSPDIAATIGIIQLVCLVLYVIPKTSVLGAVLETGYLGGAVATNLRVDNPLFSHILFPVYVGIFIWGGLYLRSAKLRALFPFQESGE